MYQPRVREQIGVRDGGGKIEPFASFSKIRQEDQKATNIKQCRKIT